MWAEESAKANQGLGGDTQHLVSFVYVLHR